MNNILQINIFSKPKNMVAKHESCDFLLPIWLVLDVVMQFQVFRYCLKYS